MTEQEFFLFFFITVFAAPLLCAILIAGGRGKGTNRRGK